MRCTGYGSIATFVRQEQSGDNSQPDGGNKAGDDNGHTQSVGFLLSIRPLLQLLRLRNDLRLALFAAGSRRCPFLGFTRTQGVFRVIFFRFGLRRRGWRRHGRARLAPVLDRFFELAGVLEAFLRFFVKAAQDGFFHIPGNGQIRSNDLEAGRALVYLQTHRLYARASFEGNDARKRFIHDHTDGVNVGAPIKRLPGAVLRAHVRRAAAAFTVLRQLLHFLFHLRQTEVDELNQLPALSFSHQHHVAGLQVSMKNALFVGMPEGVANLEENRLSHFRRQTVVFRQEIFEAHAVEIVHDDEWATVLAFEAVEDGDDIGMTQPAQGARLLLKSGHDLLFVQQIAFQRLDGDDAVHEELTCLVNHAEAPGADLFQNLITFEEHRADKRIHVAVRSIGGGLHLHSFGVVQHVKRPSIYGLPQFSPDYPNGDVWPQPILRLLRSEIGVKGHVCAPHIVPTPYYHDEYDWQYVIAITFNARPMRIIYSDRNCCASDMLSTQLNQIRGLLRRREIKVSDALLIVMRYLRHKLPPAKLVWLNRELLGYRKDDLPDLYQQNQKNQQFTIFRTSARKSELAVPEYRFLQGTWGTLDPNGDLLPISAPHLSESTIFCNMGIQQIEVQLQELDDPKHSMFSMSTDELTGAEFYCWARELVRVYDAVRAKLCTFIDNAVEELKLPSNER